MNQPVFDELPTTFMQLMEAAIKATPESLRYQQILGAIAILLTVFVNRQDADLFRGLMREVAKIYGDDAGSLKTVKRILTLAQAGLNDTENRWLQQQIDAVLN